MEATTILLVSCVLLIILRSLLKLRANKDFVKAVDKIPGPKYLPFLGNEWQFRTATDYEVLHKFMPGLFNIYGPIFRFWIMSDAKVMLRSARDAQCILQGRAQINKSGSYVYLAEFTGNTLITNSGEAWHKDRKLLNPIFSRSNLLAWLPIVNKHTNHLVEILRNRIGKKFIIHDNIHDCVSDIVYESFFGYEKNAMKSMNGELWKASARANVVMSLRCITPLILDWVYNLSPHKKQMAASRKLLNKYADQVIEYWHSRLQQVKKDESCITTGDQLMMLLQDLLLAEQSREVKHALRCQVKNIITAAVETTSVATSSVLFLLGHNYKIQEAVVSEIDEVLGSRLPDMQSLSNLNLLDRCIKEAMRMYPVVPFVERHTSETVKLDKYEVPAGCDIIVDIYHLHRDPEVWSNPETFDPDRFLPENTQGRHPFAYIPFSVGARNCIGQAFAVMTMKIMLCAVLKNFKVESACPKDELQTKFRLILYPDGGHPVRLHKRDRVISDSTNIPA